MSLIDKNDWLPSKFEFYKGHWRASRKEVGIASRLNVDCLAEWYESVLKKYAKGALVDLGCGNAPLTGMYREQVTNYVWADWPHSLHRRYVIDVETDLNRALPFDDSSFDTVLLSDVLEHVAHPDQLFYDIVRILKVNGVIIIGVPFLYCIHESPYDYHRYTRFILEDYASRNNLDVLLIREYAGGIDIVQDTLTKILSSSSVTIWMAYFVHYIFSFIKKSNSVRKFNERLFPRFPLGYIAVLRKPV